MFTLFKLITMRATYSRISKLSCFVESLAVGLAAGAFGLPFAFLLFFWLIFLKYGILLYNVTMFSCPFQEMFREFWIVLPNVSFTIHTPSAFFCVLNSGECVQVYVPE